MSSSHLSDSPTETHGASPVDRSDVPEPADGLPVDRAGNPLPPLTLPAMFRLGLFQMGLGIMAVLTVGVFNRVAIAELGVPATAAAGAIAMHQFIAPARVWFGQLSDSKPLFGFHRTGYVWVGAVLFAGLSFVALQVLWQLGGAAAGGWQWNAQTLGWTGLLGLVFAAYGLALSSSSTPFAALLVDVSDEDNRSKLVGIVWSMLMVGIVIGAIATSVMLKQLDAASTIDQVRPNLNRLFLLAPVAVVLLAIAGTAGMERRYSRYGARSTVAEREDQITLGRALRVLTASRQTAIFFTFLMSLTLGLFMQEAVLEPYGAEVFGMAIGDTTQLNAFFGIGTLAGISITGFAIAPKLGKSRTARLGCIAVAVCMGLAIAAGFVGDPRFLQTAVLLFGFASGIATTGAISLMLDLTAAETAGTFIGAWGLAQALSRALATVAGGLVLDLGRSLFAAPVLAYGLVFAVQAAMMVLAIVLLRRVNVREFQSDSKTAIAAVLEADLD